MIGNAFRVISWIDFMGYHKAIHELHEVHEIRITRSNLELEAPRAAHGAVVARFGARFYAAHLFFFEEVY